MAAERTSSSKSAPVVVETGAIFAPLGDTDVSLLGTSLGEEVSSNDGRELGVELGIELGAEVGSTDG
jgi:hypothetical protein